LLVLKVGILEFGADIKSNCELIMSLLWLFGFDHIKDDWTVDCVSASDDDCIADFSDKYNKSGWSVVVLRVLPDEQYGLHNWSKEINQLWEVSSGTNQVME